MPKDPPNMTLPRPVEPGSFYLITRRCTQRQFLLSIIWPGLQLSAAVLIIGLLIYILGAIGGTQLDGTPYDVTGLGLTGTRGTLITT